MSEPLVSIGLPVFNGARYLRCALDSILAQDYQDYELVISDNASTDETQSICLKYACRDSRIRYFRNETNIGAAPNHNRVFQLSRGKFFRWAAHDDEYEPNLISRCVEVLASAPPSVSLVYTHCEIVDEYGKARGIRSDHVDRRDPRPHVRLAHLLRWITIFNCTYALVRSETLRQTRLEGSFPFSDYVLMAELAMLGELWEIPEPLFKFRFHPGRSAVSNPTPQAYREWCDPVAARKREMLSLRTRADLEVMLSACRLPLRPDDRILCLLTALVLPSWRRLISFGGRLRRRML